MRGQSLPVERIPDFAALHPGYGSGGAAYPRP